MILKRERHAWLESTTYLLPAVVLIAVLVAYPLYLALEMSLRNISFAQIMQTTHVGTRSLLIYRSLLKSQHFWQSLRATVIYTVSSTVIALVIGFSFALLLNVRFPLRRLFRVLILLPWPIPGSIAALIWVWLFNTNYGLINHWAMQIGIISQPVPWLVYPNTAMISIITVTVWKTYPFYTLMTLAGLQAIPHEIYESAQIDGADWKRKLWAITIPMLKPILGLAIVLQTLWMIGHVDILKIMTNGGPYRSTETLAMSLYKEAFEYFNISIAAATGVILLLISIVFILVIIPRMSKQFN